MGAAPEGLTTFHLGLCGSSHTGSRGADSRNDTVSVSAAGARVPIRRCFNGGAATRTTCISAHHRNVIIRLMPAMVRAELECSYKIA